MHSFLVPPYWSFLFLMYVNDYLLAHLSKQFGRVRRVSMEKEVRILQVEGHEIRISNPNKVLFPQIGMTKWEYVLACARLADYLLPYCRDRLLTTIRFPDGVEKESFYQKNVPTPCPKWVKTKKAGNIRYILLNSLPTLVWLANLACLEFHVSFHLAEDENRPTELVFDLDPSIPSFPEVAEVAFHTREALQSMGLDGLVKTSGATGLQVYVPIEPIYSFEQTRKVNRFLAEYLENRFPQLVTIERRKQDRGKKVYFDYLQHWRNKTLIAPYSPRATRTATVSVPIRWEELSQIRPEQFHLRNVFERLEQVGDLFRPVREGKRYRLEPILRFLGSYSGLD